MKIGIMGAMVEEVAKIRSTMYVTNVESRGKREYVSGHLNGHDIVVVFSRWGKVAASSTATTLIERFGVDLMLFTGVAGAIDDRLEIGDIVVADKLVQHDMNASAIPGIKLYEVPLLGVQFFEISSDLASKAAQSAQDYITRDLSSDVPRYILQKFHIIQPTVVRGLIASGDQFITSNEVAQKLRASLPDVKCVEMEGAAVAQVAYEHDCPLVVIRAISDKANHSATIDFPKFIEHIASHFTCGIVFRLLDLL